MMPTAERHSELIADFKTDRPRLSKAQMMRIGGLASTDQARLGSDKFQVRLVAQSFGLGDRKLALVDLGASPFSLGGRERRGCYRIAFGFCLMLAEQVRHRAIVPPPIIVRGPRDRRCVVGVQADTRLWW